MSGRYPGWTSLPALAGRARPVVTERARPARICPGQIAGTVAGRKTRVRHDASVTWRALQAAPSPSLRRDGDCCTTSGTTVASNSAAVVACSSSPRRGLFHVW